MRHAAPKVNKIFRQRKSGFNTVFPQDSDHFFVDGHRCLAAVSAEGATVGIDKALADKLNEISPKTRRSIRLADRAEERRSHILVSTSLAALVGAVATSVVFSHAEGTKMASADTNHITRTIRHTQGKGSTVSRSQDRSPLSARSTRTESYGNWQLGDTNSSVDINMMSRSTANNPKVASLLDQDQNLVPSGFNANHSTGDSGNAYEFSQCTWWAYTRRQQLRLPVGSHMGNGNMWANSAWALGYWVDSTPRHVGDIIVFAAGQAGSDANYGHVAIVEKINDDGSVVTSECGVSMKGKIYSRTLSSDDCAKLQFIHY